MSDELNPAGPGFRTDDALARMLNVVAQDTLLSQGEKVTLIGALRLLDAHPALTVKLTADLTGMAVDTLTARVVAQTSAQIHQLTAALDRRAKELAGPVTRNATRPHRLSACVMPCEDCETLETCMIAGGA